VGTASRPGQPAQTLPGGTGSGAMQSEASVAGRSPAGASRPVGATGPAPTGPLRFGLLTIKDSAAAAAAVGGTFDNTASEREWALAMVDYLNANGGIAGRRLEPVEYQFDPQNTSYEVQFAAACARFTQDNRLPLVVSQGGLAWSANYQACLAKAGVSNLQTSGAMGDESELKMFPGFFNTHSPTPERRTRAQLKGLNSSGYLTGKHTVGVLVEDCPESTRTYKSTFVPLAKQLGLKLEQRTVGCLRGFGDVGSFQAQVQAAVLPFRAAGVDRVIFLSAWEALMTLFFENQSRSQGYAPSYAFTSNSLPVLLADTFDAEQLARMRGIGWLPTLDTAKGMDTANTPRCFAAAKRAGYAIETGTDRSLMLLSCELFLVLKAAVEAAGGREDPAAVSTGLARASSSYTSVIQLGGRMSLGDGRPGAASRFAEFAYSGGCACFQYTSPARSVD
jgi:ABC-type branched-subunit amino acid transport system substrate-binding protein